MTQKCPYYGLEIQDRFVKIHGANKNLPLQQLNIVCACFHITPLTPKKKRESILLYKKHKRVQTELVSAGLAG